MRALLPLLLLAGCCRAGGEAPPARLLWSGGTWSWEKLSHRISLARMVQEADGTVDLGLVGGDWSTGEVASDTPVHRVRCAEVAAADFLVVEGVTEAVVGPDGTLEAEAAVDDADLASMPALVAVLRGYAIDTDVEQDADYPDEYDPALGYTSRGFGFGLGAPGAAGDEVRFDVRGAVRWGVAGPDDPLGREDMNAAVPYARTGVAVAWSLVGFDGAVSTATASASVEYAHDPPYSDQPPVGGDDLAVALGTPSPGLAALVSFDLAVVVRDAEVLDPPQGEYLRSFGAEVVPGDDPPFSLQAEATNSSAIETAAIAFSPTLEVAWLALGDGGAQVAHGVAEGPGEVGTGTATCAVQR